MTAYVRSSRPDGADLLTTAAEAFSTRLLPALPQHLKHVGLMVGKALDIAAREWGPERADGAPLAALELATAIRVGSFDTGAGAAIAWADLRQQALECLRIDNPHAAGRPDDLR